MTLTEQIPLKESPFTDSQVIAILKQAEAGMPVRSRAASTASAPTTFYKWRSKDGGMEAPMVSRMKRHGA